MDESRIPQYWSNNVGESGITQHWRNNVDESRIPQYWSNNVGVSGIAQSMLFDVQDAGGSICSICTSCWAGLPR